MHLHYVQATTFFHLDLFITLPTGHPESALCPLILSPHSSKRKKRNKTPLAQVNLLLDIVQWLMIPFIISSVPQTRSAAWLGPWVLLQPHLTHWVSDLFLIECATCLLATTPFKWPFFYLNSYIPLFTWLPPLQPSAPSLSMTSSERPLPNSWSKGASHFHYSHS